jgi:hypothetical protein
MESHSQILERFRARYRDIENKLTEAIDKSKFDFRKMLSGPEQQRANLKWAPYDQKGPDGKYNTAKQARIFKAAQKGDRDAINYIYLKCAENIGKTFWDAFLGPNKSIQAKRINDGAVSEWASIAYETLTGGFKEYRDAKGALETFDTSKYTYGDLFQNFKFYFWNLLRNSAKETNYSNSLGGLSNVRDTTGGEDFKKGIEIAGYDPAYMDEQQDKHHGLDDETADSVITNDTVGSFLSKWKEFAQDPEVNEGKVVTPAAVLKTTLELGSGADSATILTEKFPQVSRNTVMTYVRKAVEIMSSKYGIQYEDLMTAIKQIGEDKVASYLKGPESETPVEVAPSNVEEKRAKKTAKASASPDLMEAWQLMADDPRLWTSPRKGWSRGPFIVELTKDPSLTPEDFQEWNKIPGNWNELVYNSLPKIFKRYGIDWNEVKALPQKQRDMLAGMIGEE